MPTWLQCISTAHATVSSCSRRDVKRRLSIKLPAHVVDDLAHDALVRAIAAAFDGSSVGGFRSWLHTIVNRTAVDFFRRRAPPVDRAFTLRVHAHVMRLTEGERARLKALVEGHIWAVNRRYAPDSVQQTQFRHDS